MALRKTLTAVALTVALASAPSVVFAQSQVIQQTGSGAAAGQSQAAGGAAGGVTAGAIAAGVAVAAAKWLRPVSTPIAPLDAAIISLISVKVSLGSTWALVRLRSIWALSCSTAFPQGNNILYPSAAIILISFCQFSGG